MIAEKRSSSFVFSFHTFLGLRYMTAHLFLPRPDMRWSRVTGGVVHDCLPASGMPRSAVVQSDRGDRAAGVAVHDCLPASDMPRSAVVQSDRGGRAAGVAVAPHHAVHLIKQSKEASVQGVFWLFRNVLY